MSDKKPSCSDDPNDRLNLHDWVDNSVELEHITNPNANPARNNERNLPEETASLLTKATLQGMPKDDKETTNVISKSKLFKVFNELTKKTCRAIVQMRAKLCEFSE